MKKLCKILASLFLLISLVASATAETSFLVKRIDIVGNEGLSKASVLSYVPITVGDRYTEEKSGQIISALYKSGFFTNVSLSRNGNTLIVNVVERPTIASVKVSGNEGITKTEIKKILKKEGLTTGSIFNQGVLSNFKQALQNEYYAMGYYAAKINVNIKQLPRRRISININIKAGKIAKVERIDFVGNHVFSSSTLRSQMLITTPKLWSFITKGDQYSKQKLDASIQNIESYYLNRGYIHARVLSYNAALSPDRQKVYITIHVYEGSQYDFSGFKFTGQTILPISKLNNLVTFRKGDVFSRAKVEQTNKAVAFALGDKGYAFTRIEPIPQINEHNKTVFITFHLYPGKEVYVRRIIFEGNTITAGYVLRHNIQQMEGGLLSLTRVQQSVRQLKLLGFFKDVKVQTVPVPGKNDEVDLVYHVTPTASGQIMANVSFGTLGWGFGAGITQPNFLGTGKTVGFNFDYNKYSTSYTINYYNPYATIYNIGFGANAFYTTTKPGKLNLSSTYSFDTYGFNFSYHIPVTLNNTVVVGAGLSRVELKTYNCQFGEKNCTPISSELTTFIQDNGTDFIQPNFNLGWNYDGLDRAIFPTEGVISNLSGVISVPFFKKTLRDYKVASSAQYYLPLNRDHSFILHFRGIVGYGNGYGKTNGLPFFMNYYAGGLAQGIVRGYETNTLGPLDSNGDSIGGNFLVDGGVSLIFPNLISPDNLRTSIFLDAGNVYQTNKALRTVSAGSVGVSAGIGVIWRSPVGPLDFSLARVFNKKYNANGSLSEPFQFTMGTSF